ncbi:MAG TPA: hypothetical protein VFT74_12605, partial [Isosphaeraceae bacterium]|nr:hypothetical protein [Isosphaeraceae bacterium]
VLGQIRGSISSKTLATLSVYGASSEVRRLATETLRGRDPSEYAGFLVSLLAEILKYEVRPVAGPGSPGILFVEGQRFNVRRFYAPPPAPHVGFRAGDMITYDSFGSPVILRNVGVIGRLKDRGEVMAGMPMRVSTTEVDRIAISPRQLQKEALKGALVAESQLENDVAQIEAQNQIRTMFNEVVTRALKDATGQDIDNDPKSWKTYVEKLTGYGQTRPEKAKPTFDQAVPLAYQPRFAPIAEDVGFLQTAVPDS